MLYISILVIAALVLGIDDEVSFIVRPPLLAAYH